MVESFRSPDVGAQPHVPKNRPKFKLTREFLLKYAQKEPPFGFNGLGAVVFMRTYSRTKPDGTNEEWWETVQRVVEGCFSIQRAHIESHGLGWNAWKAQRSAQEMYDRIFTMKFLPPGRGLWAMGSAVTEERGNYAALFNCAFTSTEFIGQEGAAPFCFLMDASMLGVGVGFDTKGAGKLVVAGPESTSVTQPHTYVIPDSREGWVESVRLLIESYFNGTERVEFDYSLIRPAGTLITGFGGLASGPGPLQECHENIRRSLDRNVGTAITITTIVDIMNMLGACVVAGNVRRSAELALGPADSEEYLTLKDYRWVAGDGSVGLYEGSQARRAAWGWTSNNSIFADLGMDYTKVADQTGHNGEPGYAWLENMQAYSRMRNGKDWKDRRARGANPCVEQTLEHMELCCLVETFPDRHETLEDYLITLKYAYLYGKTVTLVGTHWAETNRVMLRNRRIGTSMSGIAQFIANRGVGALKDWSEKGYETIHRYDEIYSEWLCIPRSIKMTSIKPSGTVSLLAGATPGGHFPESRYYIRRMRIAQDSPLLVGLRRAGYPVEPDMVSSGTMVVEFPINVGDGVKTLDDVTMWEQLSVAAFLQKYWADNQVSYTVTFKPHEADQIGAALDFFQYQLKAISFLPKLDKGTAFAQMPYEAITKEEYERRKSDLSPLSFGAVAEGDGEMERGCSNDTCTLF
jgi:ribonucleoside-triphosphate reductase